MSRIRSYNTLAGELEPRDAASAHALDEVVAELVVQLTTFERQILARKFEWASVAALAFLLVPAGIVSYFAWTRHGWWTWPVLVVALLWSIIWTIGSAGQFWREHEAAVEAEASLQ